MAYDSIIQTGSFTSDGTNKTLKIRSDVDKMVLENVTQWAASNNGYGYRYTWYRALGTTALMEYHPAGDHTAAVDTTLAAVELVDSSDYALGAAVATTAGTNITKPEYLTGDTTGLANGSIVRLISTDQSNLNGLDFTIDSLSANTSFELANTLATAPGIIAGAGFYRNVAPNLEIYSLFAPAGRNVANISTAASAVVTTLVDHGYAIGQQVKFSVDADSGMTQINGVTGNITAITDGTFTVDVDTTAMTAFTFPIYTDVPCQIPSCVPVGDAKSTVSETSPSKFFNQGFIGVILTGGTTWPGGSNNDVIKWTAFKAVSIDDE